MPLARTGWPSLFSIVSFPDLKLGDWERDYVFTEAIRHVADLSYGLYTGANVVLIYMYVDQTSC